jgi:hypothetical protein
MNSRNVSEADVPAFSIEELEARFDMESIAGPAGIAPAMDWMCHCTFPF